MFFENISLSILAVILLGTELIGIATALHAVLHTRTSQGAIAWGISLVTFPWLALPLYVVFGRSRFHGYVLLRNGRNEKVRHIIDQCNTDARDKGLLQRVPSEFQTALIQLSSLAITRKNGCRLLVNGDSAFTAMFDAIDRARDYILVSFYCVREDRLGDDFRQRLVRKAREGVRVCFLYDEIGSFRLSGNFLRNMQSAGIAVSAFGTIRARINRFQLNFRNHRKIMVVDGREAFVGGVNIGQEYRSGHPDYGPWRDTHVHVKGPVVQAIQFCFLEDWYWATSRIPELNWKMKKAPDTDDPVLLIPSGPADQLETCGLLFTHVINSARRRIWIASPYFVPDRQILGALKLAALRGVDVRILLPEKPDHRTVHLASFSFYPYTLPAGVRLFRYTAGFMHQKVFLVDEVCGGVGTANLDNRSFRLNFELTLLNFGRGFVHELEAMLTRDFSVSREVALEEYTARAFSFRLAVRLASLLSPLL
jgi:cardiolipin synthase